MSHSLPPCQSRHEWDEDEGVYFCAHPNVHSPSNLVTGPICRLCRHKDDSPEKPRPVPRKGAVRSTPCRYLGEMTGLRKCATCRGDVQEKVFSCEHPTHHETTHKQCIACQDYQQLLPQGLSDDQWAVGVTTAPRGTPTLGRTLDSLVAAGWENPRLFAEPGTAIPNAYSHLQTTWRESRLGAWSNWFLALAELYQRHATPSAFLLLQDDVVFCKGLRRYLNDRLWPHPKCCFVSLYCASAMPVRRRGFEAIKESDSLLGAVALVISPAAVRDILADYRLLSKHHDQQETGIDDAIDRWRKRHTNHPIFIHSPSLAHHIGETSTLYSAATASRKRSTGEFVGEEVNILDLVKERYFFDV